MKILTKKKQEELLHHIMDMDAIASDAVLMSDKDKDAEYMINSAKSIAHHSIEMANIVMGLLGARALTYFTQGIIDLRGKHEWPSKALFKHEKEEGKI